MAFDPKVKPAPGSDPITQPFWDSVKAGAMQIQFCDNCGKGVFYPRGICPHCFSSKLTWKPVSGRGKLHAFTIAYRHWHPAFQADVPYVVALVELDEGVRMMSNLVGIEPDPEHVKIEMPLVVSYETDSNGTTLPKFKPA
jgi:uncharacterized OB-fold protein